MQLGVEKEGVVTVVCIVEEGIFLAEVFPSFGQEPQRCGILQCLFLVGEKDVGEDHGVMRSFARINSELAL